MNTKEIFLDALATISKDGFPFRVQIHCVVNEAMDIPDNVRQQNPNQIMFILSSELHPNIFYDFDTRTFSFDAAFGGVSRRIYMNIDNLGAVVDELDNSTLVFGFVQQQPNVVEQPKVPQPKVQPKPMKEPKVLLKKKHLSLVWSK